MVGCKVKMMEQTILYWLYSNELTSDEKSSMLYSNPEYFEDMDNIYRDAHLAIAVKIIMQIIEKIK